MPRRYYSFGRKPSAMIGLLLTSHLKLPNGASLGTQLKVFAYQRPPDTNPDSNPEAPAPAMTLLFMSKTLDLPGTGNVRFDIGVPNDRVGLLSMELLGWPRPYDINRTHFLGAFNPFGTDEVPYTALGGLNRSNDLGQQSNRVFRGEFIFNPQSSRSADVARFILTDVQSGGESKDDVSISTYNDTAIPGGLLVVLRVDDENYKPGCAWIEFNDGRTQVEVGGTKYTKLVLNPPDQKCSTTGWA